VANAFLVNLLFEQGTMVGHFSAMMGAIILGYPIMLTAWKDLRRGLLSINELVAIAVLAAFASGKYEIAGLVAFFMLLGELIETRSAAGARASIESLIKLTPTKARRITAQGEEEVPAKDLKVGDVMRIRRGCRGGGRRNCQRRRLIQPGEHHRGIVTRGQEAGRRSIRGHTESDRCWK
jgi:Cd2+/Zn2+-exporting ATPase